MQKAQDIYQQKPLSLDLYKDIESLLNKLNKKIPSAINIGRFLLNYKSYTKDKKEHFSKQISNIDSVLFRRLKKSGYLQSLPNIINNNQDFRSPTNQSHALTKRTLIQPIVHLSIATNGDVNEFERLDLGGYDKIFSRWLVLLHEVAHCDFEQIDEPFKPTGNTLDKSDIKFLNDTLFSSISHKYNNAPLQLNEGFADVYGAIMALEASDYSDDMIREIRALQARRRSDLYILSSSQGEGVIYKYPYLYNSEGLRILLENIDDIKKLNAYEQKNKALEIVSDLLLDRLSNDKQSLLYNSEVNYFPNVVGALISYLRGEDYKSNLNNYKNHPEYKMLKIVIEGVIKKINNLDKLVLQDIKENLTVYNNAYMQDEFNILISKMHDDFIKEQIHPLELNGMGEDIIWEISQDYLNGKAESIHKYIDDIDNIDYDDLNDIWLYVKEKIDNINPKQLKEMKTDNLKDELYKNITKFYHDAIINKSGDFYKIYSQYMNKNRVKLQDIFNKISQRQEEINSESNSKNKINY